MGLHSLVQILLVGGANIGDGRFNALQRALDKRRLDLIKLLVENGADIKSVDMISVFDTWEPAIMDYFISIRAPM